MAARKAIARQTAQKRTPDTDPRYRRALPTDKPIGKGIMTGDGVNVRKGPGKPFDATGTLKKGTPVTVFATAGGWHCIGPDRWVSAQFVSLSPVRNSETADLADIARNVWDAMFGGLSIGTDEEQVYVNLAKLGRDPARIAEFRKVYSEAYGSDVIDDIFSEFSDTFGSNELTRGLTYLRAAAPKEEAKKPAADGSGVPRYSQSDIRWKQTILGANRTFGAKGCAVTAMTMAVSAVSGKPLDPSQMDAYLDANGGYLGDLIIWSVAAKAGGLKASRHTPFDISIVDKSLAAGNPCVISVNENGHWVTVTGSRQENGGWVYQIHDPSGGVAVDMKLEDGALVGAKGARSKRSADYIIVLSK